MDYLLQASLIRCPSCGFEYASGIKFCGECGTSLKIRCSSCGFENAPAIKFCGECGNPLAEASKPTPLADPRSYTKNCPPHGKVLPFVPILAPTSALWSTTPRGEARRKIAGTLLLSGEEFREVLPIVFESRLIRGEPIVVGGRLACGAHAVI